MKCLSEKFGYTREITTQPSLVCLKVWCMSNNVSSTLYFNFILPKVNTDYIRQAQVINNLRLINLLNINFIIEVHTSITSISKLKY